MSAIATLCSCYPENAPYDTTYYFENHIASDAAGGFIAILTNSSWWISGYETIACFGLYLPKMFHPALPVARSLRVV